MPDAQSKAWRRAMRQAPLKPAPATKLTPREGTTATRHPPCLPSVAARLTPEDPPSDEGVASAAPPEFSKKRKVETRSEYLAPGVMWGLS